MSAVIRCDENLRRNYLEDFALESQQRFLEEVAPSWALEGNGSGSRERKGRARESGRGMQKESLSESSASQSVVPGPAAAPPGEVLEIGGAPPGGPHPRPTRSELLRMAGNWSALVSPQAVLTHSKAH